MQRPRSVNRGRWSSVISVRGDVRFEGQVHEQQGERYAIVVQEADLILSTTVVCPTSTSAQSGILHPTVTWDAGRRRRSASS